MGDIIDLSRAVDLGAVRDKATHQHRWIICMNYAYDTDVLTKVKADVDADIERRRAAEIKGLTEELEPTIQVNIPVNMADDHLLGIDGPGCMKCGRHWQDSEGWGTLCPVGDDEFERQGQPISTPSVDQARRVAEMATRQRHPTSKA